VEARHYAQVGTALMRTLKHELGAEFTPEARAAWNAAYMLLAETMIEAAYAPRHSRAL
jgi:hemoglobin-like flavoprotein